MALLEEGRVCIKKLGRDAGSKAVITKVIDKNYVNIISKGRPKERKCNVKHLEFLGEKVDSKDREAVNALLEINEKKEHTPPAKKSK
jgi:large subunit ribosomal protein L14e